jgi:hypothetical protein
MRSQRQHCFIPPVEFPALVAARRDGVALGLSGSLLGDAANQFYGGATGCYFNIPWKRCVQKQTGGVLLFAFAQLTRKPRLGQVPVALHRGAGNSQYCCSFVNTQAAEKPHLH